MKALVKLPIGIEFFQEIRTEGFYYVDKTGLIAELLNNWGKVNLFTRPRRFGKSLNLNTLKYFFPMAVIPGCLTDLPYPKRRNSAKSTWENFRSSPSP